MKLTVLETKFDLSDTVPSASMLALEPTTDMHAIEEWEARLDKQGILYALVECTERKHKKSNEMVFLGWSLITPLPLAV